MEDRQYLDQVIPFFAVHIEFFEVFYPLKVDVAKERSDAEEEEDCLDELMPIKYKVKVFLISLFATLSSLMGTFH